MLNFTVGRPPAGQEPWREKIATATRLQVARYRHHGRDDQLIHAKVIEAAREALSDASGAGMIRGMEGRPKSGPLDDSVMLNAAGMFRLILVNEPAGWGDPLAEETIMAVVQRTLDEELAGGHTE